MLHLGHLQPVRNKICDCICKEKAENKSLSELLIPTHQTHTGASSLSCFTPNTFCYCSLPYNLIFLLSNTKSRIKILSSTVMSLFEFCIFTR